MRYIIIGAGAVGGTIGARLSAAHEVVLVARGDHGRTMAADGLTLLTPQGAQHHRVPVISGPHEIAQIGGLRADDALILAVKSQDSAEVLGQWAHLPVAGGTAAQQVPVFLAQNGVANEPLAARLFEHVHGVCLWMPTTHLQPGVVVAEGTPVHGVVQTGLWPRGYDACDERLAQDLSHVGFAAPVRADVMRWKYAKLLANLGNAVDALSADPAAKPLMDEARAEGEAVLTAADIAWTSPAEEADQRPVLTVGDVPGHQRLGGSTWQSLHRSTGSIETDYLNGEVVMLGRQHGIPTPVNSMLVIAARRAAALRQAPGSWSAAQLRAAITDGAVEATR